MIKLRHVAIFPNRAVRLVGWVVAAAWLILLVWSCSPYARVLDHATIGEPGARALSPVARLGIFLAGWTVMVLAMMLPLELHRLWQAPALSNERRLGQHLSGYLAVWVIFGGVLFAGDMELHEFVEHNRLLESLSGGLAGVALVSAGLYQLTPWKRACLRAGLTGCSPQPARAGWRQGWAHGLTCLGSCWGLMLVMFAVGQMSLGWMLVVLGLMAAERFARYERFVLPVTGWIGVGLGLLGLLGS